MQIDRVNRKWSKINFKKKKKKKKKIMNISL